MKGFQDSINKNIKNKNGTSKVNKNLYSKIFSLQNKSDFIEAAKTYNILFQKISTRRNFFKLTSFENLV